MRKTLHNEFDQYFGYFTVNMTGKEPQNIIIQVSNISKKSRTYIKFGSVASSSNKDYDIESGVITIKPGDKNYHTEGTYYIRTIPRFGLLELFTNDYYTFEIQWRTEDITHFIGSNSKTHLNTPAQGYDYLTHYISDPDSDISISLTGTGK